MADKFRRLKTLPAVVTPYRQAESSKDLCLVGVVGAGKAITMVPKRASAAVRFCGFTILECPGSPWWEWVGACASHDLAHLRPGDWRHYIPTTKRFGAGPMADGWEGA